MNTQNAKLTDYERDIEFSVARDQMLDLGEETLELHQLSQILATVIEHGIEHKPHNETLGARLIGEEVVESLAILAPKIAELAETLNVRMRNIAERIPNL